MMTSTPYDCYRNTKYFASLDALRCLSILAVIWHHTAGAVYAGVPLLLRGMHGVTLFFAISGFLITTLLLRERQAHGAISLRRFYMRRTLRIFPLYYTVIGLYILAVTLLERHSDTGRQFMDNLPYYLTYTSNWFVRTDDHSQRIIFYFAWSLATEEQFYLVWPWIERFSRRWVAPLIMAAALVGVYLLQTGMLDGVLAPGSMPYIIAGSVAPAICMGVLLAHVLHDRRGFSLLWSVIGRRISPLILLAIVFLALSLPADGWEWLYNAVLVFSMTLLVGSMVIREDHVLARWCAIPLVRHIGVVSYGMYLLHMLVANGVTRGMSVIGLSHPVLKFLMVSVAAFIAAMISYHYYESWFLRLKERFSSDPRAANPAASPKNARLPVVTLCGIRLHAVTESQCVDHILNELDAQRGGWVVTPNLDHLRRLVRDDSFATLCGGASLMVADGMPLVWASRLQGTPLPQRVAGSNLISSLSAAAAKRGRRIFLLGGDPGSADRAAAVLQSRHSHLRVVGTLCPPVGFERDEEQLRRLHDAVLAAKPDIIYVALGSPKQELLIDQLREILPGAWWLGVGISFSFLCGQVRRAPRWMQQCGLEWLHRLYQEPRRLAKRYLVDCLPFGVRLLAGAIVSPPVKLGNL